jgi:hypothetical protein
LGGCLANQSVPFWDPLELKAFFLFEWFPRSPDLYFTERGRRAREEAKYRTINTKNGLAYHPVGKQSMLDGGVGNVRLGPIVIRDQEYFFMPASGNGSCHQGFPVALPSVLYEQCIAEIRDKGTIVRRFF